MSLVKTTVRQTSELSLSFANVKVNLFLSGVFAHSNNLLKIYICIALFIYICVCV